MIFKTLLTQSFFTLTKIKFDINNRITPQINHSDLPYKITPKVLRSYYSTRKKFDYWKNHTASLQLPISNQELENKMNNPQLLLEAAKNNIVEHAARRVDLFFYTLIAYHNTNIIPTLSPTILQHGCGQNSSRGENITQACHSSLLHSFHDNKIPSEPQGILSGTHFLHSLNSTVELPGFVNQFDTELEMTYKCRKKGLNIIQLVAAGKLDPFQGLAEFFKMMHHTFLLIENKKSDNIASSSKKTKSSLQSIKMDLLHLIKQGTFSKKWNFETDSIVEAYIELLLRLTPDEKSKCKINKQEKKACYAQKVKELQEEIISEKIATKKEKTPLWHTI